MMNYLLQSLTGMMITYLIIILVYSEHVQSAIKKIKALGN